MYLKISRLNFRQHTALNEPINNPCCTYHMRTLRSPTQPPLPTPKKYMAPNLRTLWLDRKAKTFPVQFGSKLGASSPCQFRSKYWDLLPSWSLPSRYPSIIVNSKLLSDTCIINPKLLDLIYFCPDKNLVPHFTFPLVFPCERSVSQGQKGWWRQP